MKLDQKSGADHLYTKQKMLDTGYKIESEAIYNIAKIILKQIECENLFDAVAGGNDIKHSKPAPDVILRAAKRLFLNPDECMVVEDADAAKNNP